MARAQLVGCAGGVGSSVGGAAEVVGVGAGFTGSTSTDQVDSLQPAGTVVGLDPTPGSQAAPDVSFRLSISTGSITLPDVRGLTEPAAREALVDAGLDNGVIVPNNVERDDATPGTVVDTDPGPRASVSAGETVTLLIAVPIVVTAHSCRVHLRPWGPTRAARHRPLEIEPLVSRTDVSV
ncbi:PASTA domain-containing protein, partial [Modestobacter sp. KNN46-3]|uniref:PASTA domain-containing protein n=1 Tax=Modestobacter sp. KNN46-3 TaxID=2711218 RepID=UPI0019D0DBD6